ncbi:MAG: YidC/Oxa1 family insertase periplasmic-domain containing protein [Lacipirellulaceae bacterium]
MNPRRPEPGAQSFDQRFLVFLLLSVSILMLSQGLLAPPRPAADQKPADAIAQAEGDDDLIDDGATPDEGDSEGVAAAPNDPAAPLNDEPVPAGGRLAIGSLDPAGPHRMLVTLDSTGAGIERIELASPRFHDPDNRAGYLGELAAVDAQDSADGKGGGARVTVVGLGTPAAEGGLKPGDTIVSLQRVMKDPAKSPEPTEIASAADLREALATTKPRQTIALGVLRPNGDTPPIAVKLKRHPTCMVRPEEENVLLHAEEPPADFVSRRSLVVQLVQVGELGAKSKRVKVANRRLEFDPWVADASDADSATFRKRIADLGIEVVKTFRVAQVGDGKADDPADPSYHIDLEVTVRNLAGDERDVVYELTGPNGLPIEGFWYTQKVGRGWSPYGLRDVVVRYANDRFSQFSCAEVASGSVAPMGQEKPLAYAGVDAQYFASVLIPLKETLTDTSFSEMRVAVATASVATPQLSVSETNRRENASFVLTRTPVSIAAGGELTDRFRLFAGPKLPNLLAAYRVNDDPAHGLDGVLYYGWFGPVARLMLGILHTFYAIVGNYGVAIVMLTVLVRSCMFPLSRKQAQSMVKMQELKPEIDRIVEKYKTDMQKRSQAQQELFRKHNYNPAAGCLPMFLQLPIFLGLYRALAVDVELRQAPLFSDAIRFCSDLSAPDMLFNWSEWTPRWFDNGYSMFAFGPYFNLLPLATIGLFLLQQKLFMPPPTNEQMKLQQSMMKYMMVFMGLMFFKVPSGLCIYFIASSLWGIAERQLLPKVTPAPGNATGTSMLPPPITPKTSAVRRPKAKRKK